MLIGEIIKKKKTKTLLISLSYITIGEHECID